MVNTENIPEKTAIDSLLAIFRDLPQDSKKKALEGIEHISKYDNMTFWDYRYYAEENFAELEKVKNLLFLLDNCYFGWSERKIETDKVERELYLRSYPQIQVLVKTLLDIVFRLSKNAEELCNANVEVK